MDSNEIRKQKLQLRIIRKWTLQEFESYFILPVKIVSMNTCWRRTFLGTMKCMFLKNSLKKTSAFIQKVHISVAFFVVYILSSLSHYRLTSKKLWILVLHGHFRTNPKHNSHTSCSLITYRRFLISTQIIYTLLHFIKKNYIQMQFYIPQRSPCGLMASVLKCHVIETDFVYF